jgi:hypothetical protein
MDLPEDLRGPYGEIVIRALRSIPKPWSAEVLDGPIEDAITDDLTAEYNIRKSEIVDRLRWLRPSERQQVLAYAEDQEQSGGQKSQAA